MYVPISTFGSEGISDFSADFLTFQFLQIVEQAPLAVNKPQNLRITNRTAIKVGSY